MDLLPRVIAVVGMTREARIIAGEGVVTVIGGGDSAALARKLEAVLAPIAQHRPLLLSFGVCGALSVNLKAGDLIVASEVVADGRVHAVDPDWTARLAARLPAARLAAVTAGDAMIGSAAAKQTLFEATGASAADMESHIVARIAARFALPFAGLRAVSDAADHSLPPAALAGLRPDGQPDIGAVLWALARRPSQLPALLRTARFAERGFKALERAAILLKPAWRTAE